MKLFLVKIGLFFLLFGATYLFFMNKLSNSYVDENYNKFTQEAGGLIIGLSRANHGLSPDILETKLEEFKFEKPLINFAIDHGQTQFGELYLNSIKRKLKHNGTKGLYILSVSPGSFTAPKNMDAIEVKDLDQKRILGKINTLTEHPNFDYISNCYPHSLYNAMYPTNKWDNLVAHTNGWNEVKLKSATHTISKQDIKEWKQQAIDYYKKSLQEEVYNANRFQYFIKTISYLKEKGTVVLIRMPIDQDMLLLENETWFDFNKKIDSVAENQNVVYFDYSEKLADYQTFDGSHLLSESAQQFTEKLSEAIKTHLKSAAN